MQSSDLIRGIGRVLSVDETVQVLSALRQDPLVWASLSEPDFCALAIERCGNQPTSWTPGRLALLSLGELTPLVAVDVSSLTPLDQVLQERALQAFQQTQRTARPPATLREAALLALALRERRRLTGSWNGLLKELLPKGSPSKATFTLWRTCLACLYGLVPDPEDMLRGLLPRSPQRVPFEWIVQTQLSQPQDKGGHVQVFSRLLNGLPVTFQLALLRSLSLRGGDPIAAELAGQLLIGHPAFANLRAHPESNDLDLAGLSSRALALQQLGAFYQLAGDRVQALSLCNAAEIALEQWLAGLYLQRLNLQVGEDSSSMSVMMGSNQISHLAAAAGWLKNELGAVLVSHPYASTVLDQVPGDQENPFVQIKRAQAMYEREPAVARDLARQGAAGLLAEVHHQGLPLSGDFVYTWRPEDVLKILLDLELPEEAYGLAQALAEVRPADTGLMFHTSRILQKLGCLEEAVERARDLAALDPRSVAGRRLLGDLLAQSGAWPQSLAERQLVLELSAQPELADRLACAQAALKAGELEVVVSLSEDILREDANNGAAQGLLGQALVARGDLPQAVNSLVRATLLAPENLDPWLALARVQRELGEPQRALETLRAAAAALPEAAPAHLALGQACVDAALLGEALPHLKKAYGLLPASTETALLYGRTLRILGHTPEARSVLERARPAWKTCPELAYEYAQVLLDLRDAENALPVLEAALRNGLPVVEGSLLYARILVGEFRPAGEVWDAETSRARMQQASQALRHILRVDPDNLEARFLLADVLRESGELVEALETYRALADLPVPGDTDARQRYIARVQWGLGRTALCLGQIDTALAALKEACQAKPDSLPLQRALAEASFQANLLQEARDAAAYALKLASDDVETLAWYADLVSRMGDTRLAVDALRSAVQLDPHRSDLLVNLASVQLSSGDLASARTTLQAVMALEGVSRQDLRRAGHVYLRLQDIPSALACFELALTAEPNVPADLIFEIAQLQERQGNVEMALDLAQQALEEAPENLAIHLLQADLLTRLGRPQAALAVLERALRIASAAPEDPAQPSFLGEIHQRFTRLMLQAGDLSAALEHAEKAFSLRSGDPALCYQTAELAQALLQPERAARVMSEFACTTEEFPACLLERGRDGLSLLCLHLETAIEAGQVGEAARWIEEGLAWVGNDPAQKPVLARLLAIRARLLARQGSLSEAREQYLLARRQLGEEAAPWLVEAALDAQCWNDAVALAARCAQARSNEARARLVYARALVLSAERQRLCAALDCRTNAPGPDALSENSRKKFEETINAAAQLVNAGEVGRWQARGQAVFIPTPQTGRALASMPARPEDTAALVAVLRQLNNRAAAVQVARRFAEHPLVQLQLALCYLGDPSVEGIAAAERAVQISPNQPLAHMIKARMAQAANDVFSALESFENALLLWTDEPGWHDAAGDLCLQVDNLQVSLAHRRRALELDPGNAQFAFKLGQACLYGENLSEAIANLEKSTALDSDQAPVWLALASAYHQAGRLPQALEAAKKSSELDQTSAESLLIAGETALALNQPSQALEMARGAVRREPENASAVLFLSSVLGLCGRAPEGLEVLEQASPSIRAAFPVAFERAKLIQSLHGAKAALEVLEKLAKDYPDEPELISLLARTQAECGETKAAERSAFRALRLDPNQPDLTLMLARLQRKTGQLDQAVHLLGETVRMSPDSLETYLELASVYQERREYAQALQIYRQAMRLAPTHHEAYYQSGLILRDSKDYSGSEAMLRRAADLAPDNLMIRRQLVAVIALNLVHHQQEATAG